MKPLLDRARIIQNAYVVDDLEAACVRFNRLYGIGPFLGGGAGRLYDVVHRGRPAPDIEIRGVFVWSGDLCVELVEQTSSGPSAFRDLFPKGKQGFHHTAVFCVDYAAERDAFAAAGFPVASEFTVWPGCQICYVDTSAVLGHMIELYPPSERILDLYDQARRAAMDWDGRALIRPFA